MLAVLGERIGAERRRRGLTMQDLGELAGVATATVHYVESGRPATLETYSRLARALQLRPLLQLVNPRRRDNVPTSQADQVHAAMGEAQAAHLRRLGFETALDEPYQHFQFAGRADVVAWSRPMRALLHIENRTLFPDLQGAFGTFNAKRTYFGTELAARIGADSWRSETHVMAILPTADTVRSIRSHRASFESVCPNPIEGFACWWRGDPPTAGRQAMLAFFDPLEPTYRPGVPWLGLAQLDTLRPRYRAYEDAARVLRSGQIG